MTKIIKNLYDICMNFIIYTNEGGIKMNKKSTLRSVANDYLTHPKSSNGITLIALVITIIVLLILAGISISMLTRR